jgi:hypothetical protein
MKTSHRKPLEWLGSSSPRHFASVRHYSIGMSLASRPHTDLILSPGPIPKSTPEVVAIILGFLLAVAVFAAGKAARQTYMSWHRLGGKLKAYIVMIWVCWSFCITQGATNYTYFTGSIPPRSVESSHT